MAAVRPLAVRLAEVHGLLVWDVRFGREAGRETLRVSCDRLGGVGSDELALYAEDLSRELDHTDAVPGDVGYVLEVSSPGAERSLEGHEQFAVCEGREARVTLRDGRVVEGTIEGSTELAVGIRSGDDLVRVQHADVARAKLVLRGIG